MTGRLEPLSGVRRLESAASLLLKPALAAVLQVLPRARVVGGAVRDLLAAFPITDIDLATPDPPDTVITILEAAGLRAIPTGLSHGTVTAVAAGHAFEITTLRHDIETDGRHATVAFIDDWRVDAARRDFTINAMSLDRSGTLFDYFNGITDLADGRVRFVGEPSQRIAEDALRVLRFFRFQARYGRVMPDSTTCEALSGGGAGLARLSAERVWNELKRILAAPTPFATLKLMDELGVLGAILPEGGAVNHLPALTAAQAPPDPILRLAALVKRPARLVERLKLSGEEAERLGAFLAEPAVALDVSDDELRRALADTPRDILAGRVWLASPVQLPLLRRLDALPVPIFPLTGRDALTLGYTPGVSLGRALKSVRQWWLDGGCIADAEACRECLATLRPSNQPL